MKMPINKIICGDALKTLKKLPSELVDCVVTSPPYWALRDYGVDGQLGLEKDFNEYITKLCDMFDETKRVLKKTGTCWVNLGDTYGGSNCGYGQTKESSGFQNVVRQNYYATSKNRPLSAKVMSKSLIMIPFRFAIEMCNRGWILRNAIIWHKPNAMPSSVKDRFTVDFEYLFFFSKNKKYYFEQQREPHKTESIRRTKRKWNGHRETGSSYAEMDITKMCHPEGRNKRCVWNISTKSFKGAHFAVYPEELCETPIKAGCPEFVCVDCGKPKVLFQRREKQRKKLTRESKKVLLVRPDGYSRPPSDWKEDKIISQEYKPTCNCNTGFTGGIVLDPFFGAGTKGLVALKQNKNFVGIELNKKYIEIAKRRLKPFMK